MIITKHINYQSHNHALVIIRLPLRKIWNNFFFIHIETLIMWLLCTSMTILPQRRDPWTQDPRAIHRQVFNRGVRIILITSIINSETTSSMTITSIIISMRTRLNLETPGRRTPGPFTGRSMSSIGESGSLRNGGSSGSLDIEIIRGLSTIHRNSWFMHVKNFNKHWKHHLIWRFKIVQAVLIFMTTIFTIMIGTHPPRLFKLSSSSSSSKVWILPSTFVLSSYFI